METTTVEKFRDNLREHVERVIADHEPSVSSKGDVVRLLHAHESSLRGFGIKRLGLFGSFRRNRPTPDSDVDLYVEFAPGEATFDHFIGLSIFCEELLGRRVDIVTPNSLSPYLGPHILSDVDYVLG